MYGQDEKETTLFAVNFLNFKVLVPESIEWFKEDQAFSQSYVLASPPPNPLFRQQVVSLSQSSCVSPVQLTDGRGGKRGGEAKSYDVKKAWVLYK